MEQDQVLTQLRELGHKVRNSEMWKDFLKLVEAYLKALSYRWATTQPSERELRESIYLEVKGIERLLGYIESLAQEHSMG